MAIRFTSIKYSGFSVNLSVLPVGEIYRTYVGAFTFPFDYSGNTDNGIFYFYIPAIDQVFEKEVIPLPPTPTPTNTLTITITPTNTPTPTNTLTITITPSETPTNTPTPTESELITPTPTNTPTNTPTPTESELITPTPTNTPTNTPSMTETPTPTPTNTVTPTPSITSNFVFESLWSASSPIELPYSPTGTYSGIIYWGDGNISANTYDNRIHDYASSGNYNVTIIGQIQGWDFLNYATSYRNNLIEIYKWGSLIGENNSNANMFYGCSNLSLSLVSDVLNLQGITATTSMFENCSSLNEIFNVELWDTSSVINMSNMFRGTSLNNLNQDIQLWDVSNVTDMSGMFSGSTNFNIDLGGWDIGQVTNMTNMLDNTSLSIFNYSNTLINWAALIPNIQNGVTLGAYGLLYSVPDGEDARNILTGSPYNWTIVGDSSTNITPTPTPTMTNTPTPTSSQIGPETPTNTPTLTSTPTPSPSQGYNPFVSIWSGDSVTLPYVSGGTYSGTIDWGDGNVSANTFANRTHSYDSLGLYTITIDGDITGFKFAPISDRLKIIEITSWGKLRGLNNSNSDMFSFCSNLVLTGVSNTPNLSGITNVASMFSSCASITTINNSNFWNTQDIVTMTAMFDSCTLFNSTISGWNVSNVVNINSMFNSCESFNQNINNWDVSNVTGMTSTFAFTNIYNQPLNNWVVSAVTTMSNMFNQAVLFNQPLSSWTITNLTNASAMLNSSGLDTMNYSNMLIGWANQSPNIQSGVTLGASGIYYSATTAQSSRDILTNPPYNWVITDNGPIEPSPTPTSTPTVTPTLTVTPTNTQTPTNTVTPTESETPTPTPTNTQTPTITPTNEGPVCPYIVGYFNTTDEVMRFNINTNYDGSVYVVTTGGTEVYDTSYTYVQTIPNSFTANTPTYASIVFANEFVYVGGDPSNKKIDLFDLSQLTSTTVTVGSSITEMSVDLTNSYVAYLIPDSDYQQILIATQSIDATLDVSATTNGDISFSNIDNFYWIVSTGDTLVRVNPSSKSIDSTETLASGGYSGYRKTLLDDPNNGYTYILVDGQSFMVYRSSGFYQEIDLTSYSGTNTSMTIDEVNNKLYVLNVNGNDFGLIKIDISTFSDEGLFDLGSYPGFTNGNIIYDLNSTEILINFVPYTNRIYRICT
jgi:surface protein